MKVYVLYHSTCPDDLSVYGIFSSQEKADGAMKEVVAHIRQQHAEYFERVNFRDGYVYDAVLCQHDREITGFEICQTELNKLDMNE